MRTVTDCPCGVPHELTSDIWKLYDRLQEGQDPRMPVTIPAGSWRVPRIYIACHGLKAQDIPELAGRYGWESVS
jgi:hypothetical protein